MKTVTADRMKCWQFLWTTNNIYICVCRRLHLKTTCHITFTLHVYDLTFISRGRGDGGGVIDHSSRLPSTFVSVRSLNISNKTSGEFPTMSMVTKSRYIWQEAGKSAAVIVVTKTGIISWTMIFFQTNWFTCLNLIRPSAQHCNYIKLKIESNGT